MGFEINDKTGKQIDEEDQENEMNGVELISMFTVMEIFSRRRVSHEAEVLGVGSGIAFDIEAEQEGEIKVDLTKKADQDRTLRKIKQLSPSLVVVSPPCTMYSAMQNINKNRMDTEICEQKMREAHKMLEFGVRACRAAQSVGSIFVFEHPRHASSWAHWPLMKLARQEGVYSATLDMCQFGLTAAGEGGGVVGPVKKPTTLLTNSWSVAQAMSQTCKGCARHVRLEGGRRCRAAAVYTRQFCGALLNAAMGHPSVTPSILPKGGQRGKSPSAEGGCERCKGYTHSVRACEGSEGSRALQCIDSVGHA